MINPFSIPFAAPVLAGLLALSVVFSGYQTIRLRQSERALNAAIERIAENAANLAQCRENTTQLTASLDTQNAAVRALEQSSAQQRKDAEKALSDARRANAGLEARIAAIRSAKPTADTCQSANDLILGVIK